MHQWPINVVSKERTPRDIVGHDRGNISYPQAIFIGAARQDFTLPPFEALIYPGLYPSNYVVVKSNHMSFVYEYLIFFIASYLSERGVHSMKWNGSTF